MLPLFLFLQEIRDIIEIKINEQNIYLINILKPEVFNLKKYSKTYFNNIIDYSDRESQLLSIYNYIECLIYDIKIKKNVFNKYLENSLNYKIESLNYIIIFLENIFLIIFYSKSNEVEIEKYNQIDNRKKFFIFSKIIVVHIIILCLIVIGWFILRCKVDYFYSLTKYINENFEELGKLSFAKKVELLLGNSDIFEFLPKKYKKDYMGINYFQNNFIENKIEELIDWIKNKINFLWTFVYCFRNIYIHLY